MKRQIILLCLSVFILVAGTGIVAPLLAPYAKDLGATGLWVGMLYSGFYVVRLLIGTPIGRLADAKGPKAILTYSLILYPFIALSYGLAGSIAGLLGARLLHGVASAMMLPMAMAYMGEISAAGKEGKYMGLYNTSIFVANGVGPLLGGTIAEHYGTQTAFFSLLVLALAALAIVAFLPSSRTSRPEGEEQGVNQEEPAVAASRPVSPWRHSGILALASINVVVAVLSMFMVSFFTLYAASRGLNAAAIGFLIALNNIIIGATQVPLGWVVDRYDKVRLVVISSILTIILLTLFPSAYALWSISLLMVGTGLTSAVTLASSSAMAAVLGRQAGMGSTMGFLGSATSLGMVVGPLASGFLMDSFHIDTTFYFSGLMWAAGTAVFCICWAAHSRSAKIQAITEGEMTNV
ncbi:MFS transporter [Paenibacillus sambharensis]|uniref:MFS transporter n=1 Tax=Paenibacillus sambharensis TaxID=1803190 RepID=A0A2W1LCZ8_9BACL|nr:MFS transporter [Paenibacillus sambharensis]PZD96693.1 MFS transporter [Paenibacillus sambharensis]